MGLPAVRVQLLDESTGLPISDVDVLTSSKWVYYTNSNKTLRDYRGIPKGTSFDDASIENVLNDILYPYIAPGINNISGDTSGLTNGITEDTVLYPEACITIDSFTLSVELMSGSEKEITFTLKTYDSDSSKIDEQKSVVVVIPGEKYLLSFEIPSFVTSRSFEVIVDDGKNIIRSPIISYEFVYPVYTGFCTHEMVSDDFYIDSDVASNVFNEMVRANGKMIKKYVGAPCNHKALTVSDPLYANTELYPFILFPNNLDKLKSIRDTNGVDITGSFLYNSDLRITTVQGTDTDCQYSVFVCRVPYTVRLSAVGEISYNFTDNNSTLDFDNIGTPLMDGFRLLSSAPIDYRTKVENYSDLVDINKPYDGLIAYVVNEHTYFKYNSSTEVWSPTNQKIFIDADPTKGHDDYDLSIGGWDDMIINVGNGYIYTKLENRRWEYRGCIGTSGTGTGGSGSVIPGPPGKSATISIAGVQTGLPGSVAKVENLGNSTDARLKFTIPRGDPGENSTIEIGSVTTGDTPDIKNVGTKTNAILDFILPKGEKGNPGTPATIKVGEVKLGDSLQIVNVGSDTNVILDFTFPKSIVDQPPSDITLDGSPISLTLRTVKII